MNPVIQYYFKFYFFLISLIFLVSACSETTDKQQIELHITEMQQAISDKSISTFMDYLSKDFKGNKTLTRHDLRRLIFFQIQRNRNIETYKWQADIKVSNKLANVKVYLLVSGSNKVLPERGRVFTINSHWEKIDESWSVASAEWVDTVQD